MSRSGAGVAARKLCLAVIVLMLSVSAFGGILAQSAGANGAAKLVVHFIDVGQGDATLFQGPDFTLLVDAGRHDRSDVVPYLRAAGVERINLFVGTHPHSDHIGQFPQVMRAFPVDNVWLSGDLHTTRIFERTLDAILESDAGYHEPRAGEVFHLGSARIEVVHPAEVNGDFNNGSISMRIVYGDVTILLTGDAEAEAEAEMIARGHDLRADVLHVGHHGSRTSTSEAFLAAVSPKVAVYSAGQDNSYGHPHAEVIERLRRHGVTVYGTDVHGTIRMTTDGSTIEIVVERRGEGPLDDGPVGRCAAWQVDINSAPLSQLVKIVHIGEARARELIALRPFQDLDGLLAISGIGQGRLNDIKEQGLACVDTSH